MDSGASRGGLTWIFGYGSLLFRADFPHVERSPGWLKNYRRKLWQGSPDHRGTHEAPGRVATLVAEPGARVLGAAFSVDDGELDAVLAYLDLREQAGYERHVEEIELVRGERIHALVYLATDVNPSWLGPATASEIAAHVHAARGPSGANSDYVLGLAASLRELGAPDDDDEEIFAIELALAGLRSEP